VGQEADAVAIMEHLREGDHVFSNHRCHGHYLARTGDALGLIAEIMGKPAGICGGIGGSQHICAPGFKSNGVQGGTVPTAAGIALSYQLSGDTTHVSVASSATARSARGRSTRRRTSRRCGSCRC
jgi:TPP-dependent pyruvate/acetoin dehydrogenase alpha subunit